MTDEINPLHNLPAEQWYNHERDYPYKAELEASRAPKPGTPSFHLSFRGDFIRASVPEMTSTLWGFKNERDREDFVTQYDAVRL